MKRQHLNQLAPILASVRQYIPPAEFESLVERMGDVCAAANPSFDFPRFRELAYAQQFIGGVPMESKDEKSEEPK